MDNDFLVFDTTPSYINRGEIPFYSKLGDETPVRNVRNSTTVCWNCGKQGHTLTGCRRPREQRIIDYNRLRYQGSSSASSFGRYHKGESGPQKMKIGKLSRRLRKEALGLHKDELPSYIRKMRQGGYPLGHLKAALRRTSGDAEEGEIIEENYTQFDSSKFIKFPGFNCDRDYYRKKHRRKDHKPLREMVKRLRAKGLIRRATDCYLSDTETNEIPRFTVPEWSSGSSAGSIGSPCRDAEVQNECKSEFDKISSSSTTPQQNLNYSTETTPDSDTRTTKFDGLTPAIGTPILNRRMFLKRLPDLSKFSKNMPDIVNFENLPNSTGSYSVVKKAIQEAKSKLSRKSI